MQEIVLTEEFLDDMPNIGANAVKVHIIFRYLRDMSRGKYKDDFAWIRIGHDKICILAGIKSRNSVKSAIIELAEHGWISGFKRGGFKIKDNVRVNITNGYCIPDVKLENPNVSTIAMMKGEESTRKGIGVSVRKHLAGFLEENDAI